MANLTRDDVLKLAQLARINLEDHEVEGFVQEFNAILGYVEQLQALDVSDLEPTSQVTGLTNVMRKDEVKEYGYAPQDLLRNVPNIEANMIKAKRMIG